MSVLVHCSVGVRRGLGACYQVSDYVKGEVVEPVKGVDSCVFLAAASGGVRYAVPLLDELLEVVVHVLLELADGLGAEGMRDGFALSGVFGAVTGIEETALDGDECIVVLAAAVRV